MKVIGVIMSKILEKEIETLNLDRKIIELLKNNNIVLVNELWLKKRKELKELGFTDSQIHQISVKLQLNGLDLNKKVYAKA